MSENPDEIPSSGDEPREIAKRYVKEVIESEANEYLDLLEGAKSRVERRNLIIQILTISEIEHIIGGVLGGKIEDEDMGYYKNIVNELRVDIGLPPKYPV
ncbi:MAG TPA: hypothetical protein VJC12_01860 [Candidatus Paceibacterota bacterium]